MCTLCIPISMRLYVLLWCQCIPAYSLHELLICFTFRVEFCAYPLCKFDVLWICLFWNDAVSNHRAQLRHKKNKHLITAASYAIKRINIWRCIYFVIIYRTSWIIEMSSRCVVWYMYISSISIFLKFPLNQHKYSVENQEMDKTSWL